MRIEFQLCKLQQDVNSEVLPMDINILIRTEYLKFISQNLWRNKIVEIQVVCIWTLNLFLL